MEQKINSVSSAETNDDSITNVDVADTVHHHSSNTIVSGSCYRIIRDNHAGYEVQQKRKFLFFTYWKQVSNIYNGINTFSSIESAKDWIKNGCKRSLQDKKVGTVVWVSDNCH